MPVGIAVSPVAQTLPPGKTTVLASVRNSGTATETVHVRPEVVHQTGSHGCGVSPSTWATVSPSTVILAPGETKAVSIHVAVPGDVSGTVDLAAVFAVTGAGKGNLTASAGVGSQVVVHNGTSAGAAPKCAVAAPVAKSSVGGDVALVLGIGAAMLITLLVVAGLSFKRWRTRRLARHGEEVYGR